MRRRVILVLCNRCFISSVDLIDYESHAITVEPEKPGKHDFCHFLWLKVAARSWSQSCQSSLTNKCEDGFSSNEELKRWSMLFESSFGLFLTKCDMKLSSFPSSLLLFSFAFRISFSMHVLLILFYVVLFVCSDPVPVSEDGMRGNIHLLRHME